MCGRIWRAQPSQAHATTTHGSALFSRVGQVIGNINTTCASHVAFPLVEFVLVLRPNNASDIGGPLLGLPSHECLVGAVVVC